MEELVTSWLDYARQRTALLERLAAFIRESDGRSEANRDRSDPRLKALQRQFYSVVCAERLRRKEHYADLSPEELVEAADRLLSKRAHVPAHAASDDMRTAEEQRLYVSLKVTWSNLLKKAKIRAVDNRGGPFNPFGRGGRSR